MPVDLAWQEAGGGRPVVLLHAFPLDASMWDEVRARLASTWQVLTPDLRGFGSSPRGEEPPALAAMADDVVRLLDRLGLDRVVLGGLSMGGYVTLDLLRRHAERVRAVVLADTKASADAGPARANRLRIADTVTAERSPRVLHEAVLPNLLGPATTRARPEVVQRVSELLDRADPDAIAWAQRAMAARGDAFDVLRSLTVPVLVVRGSDDALSTRADADAMAVAAADARVVELPGVGHLSAMEDPAGFAGALAGFLDALRTP